MVSRDAERCAGAPYTIIRHTQSAYHTASRASSHLSAALSVSPDDRPDLGSIPRSHARHRRQVRPRHARSAARDATAALVLRLRQQRTHRCWSQDASDRPTFTNVAAKLQGQVAVADPAGTARVPTLSYDGALSAGPFRASLFAQA